MKQSLIIVFVFIASLIGLISSLLHNSIFGIVCNGTSLLICSIVIANGISKYNNS